MSCEQGFHSNGGTESFSGNPQKSVSQQLLEAPMSCLEIPFFDSLVERHRRTSPPVRARRAVASEFYSEIFNVFAHLTIVRAMGIASQRLGTGQLIVNSSDGSDYNYRFNHSRFADQDRADYQGSLAAFMRGGDEITTSAIACLETDITSGTEQSYRHLWTVLQDADRARYLMNTQFKKYDKLARVQLPFDLVPVSKNDIGGLGQSLESNIEQAMELAVYHAVARTLTDGRLPKADKLADSLHEMEGDYEHLSSVNRELLAKLFYGNNLIDQLNQDRREGKEVIVPRNILSVLNDYINNPHISDAELFDNFSTQGRILYVARGPLHPSLKDGPWKNSGNCGGSRLLASRIQDDESIGQFEEATGGVLPRPFNAARVDLRIGKELAKRSIYEDPIARAGIVRIASYVQNH